jgi:hypothetical protein
METEIKNKVLRENRNDVVEFNACDKADDFKGKNRKENLAEEVHQ